MWPTAWVMAAGLAGATEVDPDVAAFLRAQPATTNAEHDAFECSNAVVVEPCLRIARYHWDHGRDLAEIKDLLHSACAAGHARSCAIRDLIVVDSHVEAYAMELHSACTGEPGDVDACGKLATVALSVKTDWRAVALERGCALGDGWACDMWADRHDGEEALDLRMRACELGHEGACDAARAWKAARAQVEQTLAACAEAISTRCGDRLVALDEVEHVLTRDERRALVRGLRQHCTQDHGRACAELAWDLSSDGVPVDDPERIAVTERACERGAAQGCSAWLALLQDADAPASRLRRVATRGCALGSRMGCSHLADTDLSSRHAPERRPQVLHDLCVEESVEACDRLLTWGWSHRDLDLLGAAALQATAWREDADETRRTWAVETLASLASLRTAEPAFARRASAACAKADAGACAAIPGGAMSEDGGGQSAGRARLRGVAFTIGVLLGLAAIVAVCGLAFFVFIPFDEVASGPRPMARAVTALIGLTSLGAAVRVVQRARNSAAGER